MREENAQKELERQWKKIQLNSHYGAHFYDPKEVERIAEEGRRLIIKNKRNQVIDELLK